MSRVSVTKALLGYVGPYRLLNVVNTGQTSQIWQAYDDGKQQLIGVKTLRPEFLKDREQIRSLRWEYTVSQKVKHERIVDIFQYGNDRGNHYLAMEWFASPNMKQRIQQGLQKIAYLLPLIIEHAAEALAYFNQMGWVHRDIKPDNYLVADNGDVKLIDFSLARRRKGGLARLLGGKSKVQGTKSYMSPEQIRGEPLDQRADVYSFGCTLHELVSGKPPFTGSSPNELLTKHLKSSPPPLDAANKNITPEFAQLVRRCLAKDPAARPESVDVFLRELRMNRVFRMMPRPPRQVG